MSRDHHHALVLARFVTSICIHGGMDDDAILLVRERFSVDVAPHLEEEALLVAALQGRGIDDLITRARHEHAELVTLLDAAHGRRTTSVMLDFAQLLSDHVRFAEGELYPACEEVLSEMLDRQGEPPVTGRARIAS